MKLGEETMLAAHAFKTIAAVIISFLAGFLLFYLTNPLSKEKKKQHIEEITSQLINFVIYIWLGKLVVNIEILVQDPLTILAYPSNSSAFYVAAFLSLLTNLYKVIKHDFNIFHFLQSFLPVFLAASFIFECIKITSSGTLYDWQYLSVLVVLLLIYMFVYERMTNMIMLLLFLFWSISQLVLSWSLAFTTVFGYIIAPTFFIMLIGFLFLLIIFNRKKVL